LEGLEISIVRKQHVLESVSTKRLDPEYFQKRYLKDEVFIAKNSLFFRSSEELGITIDASAFYPSIEEFYGSGDLPFYRVGDVDGLIDDEGALRIPHKLCAQFPTLRRVQEGDILFTKGGAIDRSGYVTKAGAVSRDLIFLNTSILPEYDRLALFAYFQTALFKRLLTRSSSQTAQPHLTITLVRQLPFFQSSYRLSALLAETVLAAYHEVDAAKGEIDNASGIMLDALGLTDWMPPEPLTYEAKASDALAAGRLDAQYFRPLFEEVEQRLRATGGAIALAEILTVNARGRQPLYDDAGLPVVNSKHVRTNRVILDGNRTATEAGSPVQIRNGDVLVNGTGVGTIGRAAVYLHDDPALPDNHVTVLRTNQIDPVYLSVFLNSPLGQWQIERHIKGSSGQIELYPHDIAQIVVWDAPDDIQQSVRKSVLSAFDAEHRAKSLLDAARRAVEIAIEDNEAASLTYLAGVEGVD